MTLADDFSALLAERGMHDTADRVRDAMVLQIGNVAEYVAGLNLKPPIPGAQFAAITPPFDNLWMEFPLSLPPSESAPTGRHLRIGLWAVSVGPPTLPERGRLTPREWVVRGFGGDALRANEMTAGMPDWIERLPDETAGVISFTVVVLPMPLPMLGSVLVPFDLAGNVCEVERDIWWHIAMSPGIPYGVVEGFVLQAVITGLYGLSFLHCKNVATEPHEVESKLQRARQRRGKLPFLRYHTLHVHPVGRARGEETEWAGEGDLRALHIRRGHFKRFSDERALFGRWSGTYWWSQRTRGTVKAGVVDKDYVIHPPEGGRESEANR